MDMGLGTLGSANIIHLLPFRFRFALNWRGLTITGLEVTAARPELDITEAQIDYLNGRTWIPTKAFWTEMEVSFWDVAGDDKVLLLSWLATMYDFTNPVKLRQASKRSDYAGTASLELYSGCGDPVERWTLGDVWPRHVNWGELSMSDTEPMRISATLRYSQVAYLNLCGNQPTSHCTPCGSTSNTTLV